VEFLILAVPLVLLWLLVLRPAQRRQRESLALQHALREGQEVMTTSGLYGRITTLADDRVELEVSPGVRVHFARGAVARVLSPQVEDPAGGEMGESDTRE
jgi:preprotein translocase subunit YajC